MTNQQQEMIEYTIQEAVRYLIEDNGISMEQAMEQFYMSEVFEKLCDIETGSYLDGSAYIYEMLKREMQRKSWNCIKFNMKCGRAEVIYFGSIFNGALA